MNNWGRVNLGAASPGWGVRGKIVDGGDVHMLTLWQDQYLASRNQSDPSAPSRHFVPLSGQLSPSRRQQLLSYFYSPLHPFDIFYDPEHHFLLKWPVCELISKRFSFSFSWTLPIEKRNAGALSVDFIWFKNGISSLQTIKSLSCNFIYGVLPSYSKF